MARKIGMGRAKKPLTGDRWEDYLDPDEKLLWQGAPAAGLRFSGKGLVLSVFGLFFLGFSVFWVGMALQITSGGAFDYAFPLFGTPFVLIGLWLVAGHWFFDAYKRKRSRYALTDKRAIIARTLFGRRLKSFPITADSPISLIEGDLDTVTFAQQTSRGENGPHTVDIGFNYIRDGREVYTLLRKIREGNT